MEINDGEVLTALQVKELQKRNAQLEEENQQISSMILHIYADHDKRFGAYKIAYVLDCNYGINISVGRVYRLMKTLQLPKMSTDKPRQPEKHSDNSK